MIERQYSFPLSFHGTIFDVETTGLNPSEDELVTIGYFSQGQLRIYQRDDQSQTGSKDMKKICDMLSVLPRPYFSYNKSFEEKWLGIKFDHDMMSKWKILCEQVKKPNHRWCRVHRWVKTNSKGLCPECGSQLSDRIKWPSSAELISLPHAYFFQSDIDGKEVPEIWKKFARTQKRNLLELIIFHNFNDLVRDYCLYAWDETVAILIGDKLKESAAFPRSIFEVFGAAEMQGNMKSTLPD